MSLHQTSRSEVVAISPRSSRRVLQLTPLEVGAGDGRSRGGLLEMDAPEVGAGNGHSRGGAGNGRWGWEWTLEEALQNRWTSVKAPKKVGSR